MSGMLGLKGPARHKERALQAARDSVMLAEYLNLPVHIAHVFGRRNPLRVIEWGKSRGVKGHSRNLPALSFAYRRRPGRATTTTRPGSAPLRGAADRDALRKAVKDGLIDILVTDHAPRMRPHEKDDTLDKNSLRLYGAGSGPFPLPGALCWMARWRNPVCTGYGRAARGDILAAPQ